MRPLPLVLTILSLFAAPVAPSLAQMNDAALFRQYPGNLQGVIGELSDRSATARICRKDGRCLPGDGTNIETGDTIQAPKLVTLYIEDPKGFSMHGLKGKVANTRLSRLGNGDLAVEISLRSGKMQGTIREIYHLIRMGRGYCLARRSDYVAETRDGRAAFKIEKGSADCHDGRRKVTLDTNNPVIRWDHNAADRSVHSAPEVVEPGVAPSSGALETLPDIKPF